MTNTAKYKKSKVVDNRTINYRFSVDSKEDVAYTDLVKVIKAHNADEGLKEALGIRPHYLRVRGRGRGSYTFKGIKYSRSIPDAAADYFDVYVVRDTDKMEAYFQREAAKKSNKSLKSKIVNAIKDLTITTEGQGVSA